MRPEFKDTTGEYLCSVCWMNLASGRDLLGRQYIVPCADHPTAPPEPVEPLEEVAKESHGDA